MKITDKDSLIEAQYSVLLKVEELNYLSNNEHSCIERNKIKELAFAALISMNAEGIFQKEENIFFRNILMPKVIFFEKYPFLRNKVLDLPIYKENTDQTLNEEQCTNNETSDVIVIEDEAKAVFKDMARNTDGVFNEDKEPEKGIQETSEKIKQAEGSEQVNIPDETDTVPQIRLIYDKYRLEDSIMKHHETEYAKFLDTMWFNIFHITCNVKDGFMPENFTIIVFPTEIAKDRQFYIYRVPGTREKRRKKRYGLGSLYRQPERISLLFLWRKRRSNFHGPELLGNVALRNKEDDSYAAWGC